MLNKLQEGRREGEGKGREKKGKRGRETHFMFQYTVKSASTNC